MDFRLLGPLEVFDGDGPIEIGSHRQRALLALLAINPNRVVSTDRILDALWGDDATGKENAMWVAVSRLRSALEPNHARGGVSVVATRDHGYVLDVDPNQIDITRFETRIDVARGLSDRDAQAVVDEIDEALALWRGDPLQEFAFEEFVQPEVARLEDRRLEALELRADAQLGLGSGREQVTALEALHDQHPLREKFVELLMRSLYQASRQADALRVFDRHRRVLGEEMGLDVSPELARLEEQILLHDPAVRRLRRTEVGVEAESVTNPFKGLRAFTEADTEDYFGRDKLISDIVRRLGDDHTFVALVGASGSGKSSAVRAGVIPALRKGALPGSEDWLIARMLPGAHPMAELEVALLRSSLDTPDTLEAQLADPRTGLLKAALRIIPDGGCLVLVIDQFEELFTLVEDESERVRFLDLLGSALDDPHHRVKVVLTLRADFYDQPLRYPVFAERLNDGVVNVTALTPDEFEAAAQEPMRRAGVGIEPAVLASLLTEVLGQSGALPLFQYTLTMLFDRRLGDVVTLEEYRAMGGLRGALTRRADQLMTQLSATEQAVARQLFLRLVTVSVDGEWSRRRVAASELISLPIDLVAMQYVIETFSAQRLLSSDRDRVTGSPTVEVAHEALIFHWPRFRVWIEDDRQSLQMLVHLGEASRAWEAGGGDAGDLYRGARLGATLEWIDESRPTLSDLESRFVAEAKQVRAAESEAERQRLELRERQNRRLRRSLVAVGAAAIAAIVLGVTAFQQQQRAGDAAEQASIERTVAETGRLAAAAPARVASNRQVALLMAAEAFRRDPSPDTLGALQRVLLETGNLIGYLGNVQYSRALWTPDGRFIVGLRQDGVDIFDVETAFPVAEIDFDAGDAINISPAGDLLAVSTAGTRLLVLDLSTGEQLGDPLEHHSRVTAVRFSPDGAAMATGDRSGMVRIFDSGAMASRLEIVAHPEIAFVLENLPDDVEVSSDHEPDSFPVGVLAIGFTDDGSVVATTGGNFIRTWSVGSGERLTETQVDRPAALQDIRVVGRPSDIRLLGGGEAVIRANRFIQHWDLVGGKLLDEYELKLSDQSGVVTALGSVAVALTQDRVAVTEFDTVTIIDISTGDEIVAPFEVQAGSTAGNVAVSPDDRAVAVAGTNGIVLWAIDGRELLALAVPAGADTASALQVSPDGKLLAVGSGGDRIGDDAAELWLLEGDRPTRLTLPTDDVNRLWMDLPDHVITQGLPPLLEVIGARSLKPTGIDFGVLNNYSLAASPDGRLVAIGVGAPDPVSVHVFETSTGRPVTPPIESALLGPDEIGFRVAFNADGTRLLIASTNGAAVVLDTRTWERIGEPISPGGGAVVEGIYSHDGTLLATIASDGIITLRDPVTNQPLGRELVGATAGLTPVGIRTMAFSVDGRYFLSTADRTTRLWDVDAGDLIGSPIVQDERSNAFPSSDGRWVAAKRGDHILVYDLDPTRWFDVACQAAGRNLTAAEWEQFGPTDASPRQTCPQWAPPIQTEGI